MWTPTTCCSWSGRPTTPTTETGDGHVQLREEPANGQGRSYLIESRVGLVSELIALVDDYEATAQRIEDVPMKGGRSLSVAAAVVFWPGVMPVTGCCVWLAAPLPG